MKSRIFSFIGILLIFLSTSLYAAVEDRIVAIVNNEVITLSEFDSFIKNFMKNIEGIPEEERDKELPDQIKLSIMNQLIDRKLVEQEAVKLKISVNNEDIEGVLNNILKYQNTTIEKLSEALINQGSSIEAYKDEIRRDLLKRKVIDATVKSKVTVSEEETGEYYAKHRKEYEGKPARRIQQILIAKQTDADDSTKEALRSQAEAILKKLREGAEFDLMVQTYSQGPAAGVNGDLGFVEQGIMFPEVDAAAFTLKPGGISDVIESPVGFHIIRIIGSKGAGARTVEEIRDEIISRVGNEKMKKKFTEWVQNLREKSFIDIRL